MIIYQPGMDIPDHDMIDLGPPENLGGRVISGSPRISARIDFNTQGMMGGIFEATAGVIEIQFPFTEHATIIEGKVTLTDRNGTSHTYNPGDSYLILQGEVIRWEVRSGRVRKSFFNITRS